MTVKVRGTTLIGRLFFKTQTLPPGTKFGIDSRSIYPILGLQSFDQVVEVLPPRVEENGTQVDIVNFTKDGKTDTLVGQEINNAMIKGKEGIAFGSTVEVVSVPPEKTRFWRRSPER